MKVAKVAVSEAVGHRLLRNQAGPDGRKVLKKGRLLNQMDVDTLDQLGLTEIHVAILDPNDIDENSAAQELGTSLETTQLQPSSATTGRVNLIARQAGVLKVNTDALLALNEHDGITLATISTDSQVRAKQIVATAKIIPYAVPQQALNAALQIIEQHHPVVDVRPFTMKRAALITTGNERVKDKVVSSFTPALTDRLASYGVDLASGPFVSESQQEIADAIEAILADGPEMIIVAGETSVMDIGDLTPQAIQSLGGEIVHHGVPVEPGNLLMLAYIGDTPIVGAPGCARSKHFNVVDMVLPRLATGERLMRRDLVLLGHGGYLQNV